MVVTDWTYMALDGDKLQAFVNMVMNIRRIP